MPLNANLLTTSDWLRATTKKLELCGIATARLDALVLLEDVLGKNRTHLLANPDIKLTQAQLTKLNNLINRRAKHEPLAYIRGKSEFYGREFIISPATLEPRPETETMIDTLKSLPNVGTVADIGTGSGCLAITAQLELPNISVYATEINQTALVIAKQNATLLGADATFYRGDLLKPLINQKFDLLLCNLPYVPDSHTINQAAMFEPKVAIFGGLDGLDIYRKLFEQISLRTQKPTYVLTESLPFQHHGLATSARKYGYILEKTDDFIQLFTLNT